MKISKQQLIDMKACKDGIERFIEQTNNTDELVDVLSLIGGKNTVGDLIWLAEETLSKEKLVRFTCDLALINIEKIKLYTDQYDLIVEFLMNPTTARVDDSAAARVAALRAASAAVYTARVAARAVIHAAIYAALQADRVALYAVDSADTLYAVRDAVRAGATQDQINTLLVKMFDD